MTQPLLRPRCLPLALWPAGDRDAWEQGLMPGNVFRSRHVRPGWRDATIETTRKGYGVWLGFLMTRADWDPAQAPPERVTVPRLRAFYRFLCRAENEGSTVTGRFDGLKRALRLLAPEQDWDFVRRPDGAAIRTLRPQAPRPKPPPPAASVLAEWACRMMDEARATPPGPASRLRYRDGLIFALLAWRARRLRSMAALRVGHELCRTARGFRIELAPAQVKTGCPDGFDLPDALTSAMAHYLAVVRPALLAGRSDDALWIGRHGRKLSAKALAERVHKWTGARFGQAFGPHRFRHALSTTAVLGAPADPMLAPNLLGISEAVVARHYNLAGQVNTANTMASLIAAQRARYARNPDHPPRSS